MPAATRLSSPTSAWRWTTRRPSLNIAYPHPGDPLALVVEALGSVADPHLQGWSLDFGQGTDPQTWARIHAGTQEVANDFLGAWNTFGLQGDQTLRILAVDKAGNQGELRVPIALPTRTRPHRLPRRRAAHRLAQRRRQARHGEPALRAGQRRAGGPDAVRHRRQPRWRGCSPIRRCPPARRCVPGTAPPPAARRLRTAPTAPSSRRACRATSTSPRANR